MIYNFSGPADISDLPDTVTQTIADLNNVRFHFDTIAVRGISGLMVGSPVSVAMEKFLVIIRKPTESGHSNTHVGLRTEGRHRYIFLDDFIDSGETRDSVMMAIADKRPDWTYVGSYLYQDRKLVLEEA